MRETDIINDPRFWDRMRNWYHSCWYGGISGTCGSAEKRYKSPQCWDMPQPRLIIDTLDGQALDDCWKTLPMRPRLVVKWWWIRRAPMEITARKAGLKRWEIDAELRRSVLMMRDKLYNIDRAIT